MTFKASIQKTPGRCAILVCVTQNDFWFSGFTSAIKQTEMP